MRLSAEAVYRNHLAIGEDCLTDALDSVVPADTANDDPATALTRGLCFDDDGTLPPLCEQRPGMMNHGVRQVALGGEIFADEEIRDRMPVWLSLKLLGQSALVADVGLKVVSDQEVAIVNAYGPKFARAYNQHPEFGYDMAQAYTAQHNLRHPSTAFITAFIGRHHAIQAKNSYGLSWSEIDTTLIDPTHVDLAVAFTKPLDYLDDCIARRYSGAGSFAEQVMDPSHRFISSIDRLLSNNQELAAAIEAHRLDSSLPSRIAKKIVDIILTDDPEGISAVYRQLRPNLLAGMPAPTKHVA